VFGLFEASKYSDAAAYVLIMIIVILAAIGIINAIVNWLLAPKVKVKKGRK
jgi:iron(III) transport system permease protein